jgi:hypothetical protein
MTEPNIEDKIEEILWDMISQDHHINHMADDLNSMDTAEDRQANIDETIKQIRPLIANQVRDARIDEIKFFAGEGLDYIDASRQELLDRIKELGE